MALWASPSSSIFCPPVRSGASVIEATLCPGPVSIDRSASRDVLDRLLLGVHDPLEGRVAGLDHAGGDRDHGGQGGFDHVVSGRRLTVDRHLAFGYLDVVGIGQGRDVEQLGEHLGQDPGVAVGRLGAGDDQVELLLGRWPRPEPGRW